MSGHFLNEWFPLLTHNVQDMNGGSSALAGDYVNMSKLLELAFVIAYGDGTAGHDIEATLYQATSNAGAGATALNCLQTGRIYTRQAADFAAYAALTTGHTADTQATADEVWTDSDSGEQAGVTVLLVRPDDLDDGFTHVRLDLSDPTASKIVAVIAMCRLKRGDAPANVEVPSV